MGGGLRNWLALALLLVLACAWPPWARAADEAGIEELVVTNSAHELLLYFRVKNAVTPEMEQAVKSGLPLTLTFFVELYRQRSGWLDLQVLGLEFSHHLHYDTLKNEFRVVREGKGGGAQTVATMAEARQLMTRVNDLALLSLAELIPGQAYTLRVRAQLAEKGLPLSFHRLLPLRRLWSFETAWHDIEFHY
ncbi:DUF4390 domain-containing protein [Desulfurivibrio sp. D14AmB]|uniref:DUF4390 domain-containing protein n=1 Tax=Desulfurivibrio sp. D14AmB TaxID=3374370 RepID=UPI00376F2583